MNNYQNNELESWLRTRDMSTQEFTALVGCSRPVIWKVKKGLPICQSYATRIMQITDGEVKPKIRGGG